MLRSLLEYLQGFPNFGSIVLRKLVVVNKKTIKKSQLKSPQFKQSSCVYDVTKVVAEDSYLPGTRSECSVIQLASEESK